MAEAVVAVVINKAIAGRNLLEARSQMYSSQENIQWIESQMRTLQSYLKDAEFKKARSPQVANWIISTRDLAQDVEDILDTYLTETESQNIKRGPFHALMHASCTPCYGGTANNFALEMEKIKKRAAELEASRTSYGITAVADAGPSVEVNMRNSRKLFLRAREPKKIFGQAETLQKLEAEMLSENKRCRAISVVGPAGVGKTTVAKRIYQKVKNQFQGCAIVYVPQEPKFGELLLDIAKQVGLSEFKMQQNMQNNLFLLLQEKRCLIFLDDVQDTKTWDLLRDVLLTNSENGSRIIVTSQNKDVGMHVAGGQGSYPLDFISESDGKELFYDMILSTSGEVLSPVLKDIGDRIVTKCGGWPLAIVLVAGMLRVRERRKATWDEVLERMSECTGQDDRVMILALSYKDLPTELKPFFLYFGIFAENREIFLSELIHMWVAEKLIFQVDDSRNLEDIAEAYIDKLVARNLIQLSRIRSHGGVISCRTHHLLHDLCVRVAKDTNFFCTWSSLQSRPHRIVTYPSSLTPQTVQNSKVAEKLRAFFCFKEDNNLSMLIKRNASDLRLLRLLIIEVEYTVINLPNEIANLSGLICLKVMGEFITIPSSIQRLRRLETLEVRTREVPENILKMKNLKHLFLTSVIMVNPIPACGYSKVRKIEDGVEVDLQNLETLDFKYQYGHYLAHGSFKKLFNLKKLKIFGAEKKTLEALSDAATVSPKLEYLKLRVDYRSSTSQHPKMDLSRYQNLVTLHLFFDMKIKMNCSIKYPQKLAKITLGGINITEEENPLESLKGLSRLEIIKLKKCKAQKLDFSGEDSFPLLQMVMIKDTKFDELVVDEKAIPKLDKFIYQRHPSQQSEVPERLKKMQMVMTTHSAEEM